jgi:hypothetical protein
MINGNLQDFVRNVIAKGNMGYGDVRRLQRDYLPSGITNREDLELLIPLNAALVRADKAWAQWFVASVVEFFAERDVREHSSREPAGEWAARLLVASTTRLGRRIARQVRGELERQHSIQSTNSDRPHPTGIRSDNVEQAPQAGASENDFNDCSLQMAKQSSSGPDENPAPSRAPRCTRRRETIAGVASLAGAAHGCLAGYLPAVQRSHLVNFQSSRACLVLAPCC